MRRLFWLVAFPFITASGCGDAAGPEPQEPLPAGEADVTLAPVANGLSFPLLLTAPPGDQRLFIVEKGGRIRIVANGALLEQPFLDISASVSRGSEQGLLGLAFSPAYATDGRFFINYTDTQGDTHVSAWTVSTDPNVADAASERVLLTVEQPYSNHNGGHLAFGPDSYLYIGMGDGGSGGDPQGHGQDGSDLLGSLLRLDVSGADGYAIPVDNPFVGSADDLRGELWDIGLRNPWRFSFDRATGDLYIADVGQSSREEINAVTAAAGGGRGINYGWNVMEGLQCFGGGHCDQGGLTLPVLDYGRGDGCSVTGGFVYRGSAIPELQGQYFYSDYCQGWVRSFRLVNGVATDQRQWPTLAPGGSVPSFGEDVDGELYVIDASGSVYRIVAQ